MTVELLLLAALIIIFIISFCGLLQKIRKTYETERELIERNNSSNSSFLEMNNPTFIVGNESGIYPTAPPPYSQLDLPPKYEDIIKDITANHANTQPTSITIERPQQQPISTISQTV